MNNNKGYYVYSTVTVIMFVLLFGAIGYFTYDIIIKLSTNQFNNSTLIQTIITLIITVFIGGWITKKWEFNNNKRLDKFKSHKEIALKIIDLSGIILSKYSDSDAKERAWELLRNENFKVKLLFDDDLVGSINIFLKNRDDSSYNQIIESLKKYF